MSIITNILRYIVIGILILFPLFHGQLFPILGINFSLAIDGNFEYSKSVFFTIIGSIISIWYILYYNKKNLKIPIIILVIAWVLWVSTLLSLSPLTSLTWGTQKWHWFLLFLVLLIAFTLLYNCDQKDKKVIVQSIIYSLIPVSMIAIKEYFFPSFNYGDLWSRAIWSFGHPNYLALYIIVLIPLIPSYVSNTYIKYIMYWLGIATLLLTKSLWWIAIFSLYVIYELHMKYQWYKYLKSVISIVLICVIWYIIYSFWFHTKLHSFISRFYIWETTIRIILSDIKILLVWWWLETLSFVFDNYKSEYLYIFENIGFTADRPHNILLNIWYWVGSIWVILFLYTVYKFIKNFKNSPEEIGIVLFVIFCIFNYPSITSLFVWILLLSIISKRYTLKEVSINKWVSVITIWIIWISSIFITTKLYISELYFKKNEYTKAIQVFPNTKVFYKLGKSEYWAKYEWLKSEAYFISKIIYSGEIIKSCNNLVTNFYSAENYFYCWKLLEESGYVTEAISYYKEGLKKIPDVWNPESIYFDNFLIKHTFSEKRFFHEKYSNLQEILKKSIFKDT